MAKNILYPGTLDRITAGHIDLIKKALKIADKAIVAISENSNKNYLFDSHERMILVEKSLYQDLKIKKSKVQVITFNSLTTDLCKKMNSKIILRGLRAVSDFEYEFQLANMNRAMSPDIESVFLTPKEEYSYISSSLVKEIATMGGDVTRFVDPVTLDALNQKIKN